MSEKRATFDSLRASGEFVIATNFIESAKLTEEEVFWFFDEAGGREQADAATAKALRVVAEWIGLHQGRQANQLANQLMRELIDAGMLTLQAGIERPKASEAAVGMADEKSPRTTGAVPHLSL